jgi:hypothetical protein
MSDDVEKGTIGIGQGMTRSEGSINVNFEEGITRKMQYFNVKGQKTYWVIENWCIDGGSAYFYR